MSDTQNATGNVTSGDASQGTAGSNDLTQAIAAAVSGSPTLPRKRGRKHGFANHALAAGAQCTE
jgi:hypothetical protein